MMLHVKRRAFITLLGGAAAWPVAARAQGTEGSRVLGVLMTSFPEADPEGQARIAAFLTTFQKLGWVDGRNCRIVVRWAAGDLGRMHRFAKELIALHPDVLVVMATPALMAVQRITRTVPIVFIQISDPVGAGFVTNMAHPGGNMTGFANFEEAMGGKWLELLMEVAPHLTQVAVLIAGTAVNHALWKNAQTAAASTKVSLVAAEVHDPSGVETAIAAFATDGKGGLIVLPDPIFNTLRDSIVEWATRHRLPTIYPFAFYVRAGGLVSYGIDQIAQFQGAAEYVDRILKGEKPGDLPVQAPTKFELVINLKAAKALGLTVPPTLLARADEVIE
jgi:putative ABC transport system substrate-binding protein